MHKFWPNKGTYSFSNTSCYSAFFKVFLARNSHFSVNELSILKQIFSLFLTYWAINQL